jgi:hypothetical protein
MITTSSKVENPIQEKTRVGISRFYYYSSILASILILASSALGIFVSSTYARYTANLASQARAQDVRNTSDRHFVTV